MYCLSRLVVFLSVIKINGRTPIRYDSTEKKKRKTQVEFKTGLIDSGDDKRWRKRGKKERN